MKRLALLVVLAASSLSSGAHAEPFVKGPYLQNIRKDAATIMWQSDPIAAGVVRVRLPGGGEKIVEAPAAGIHEVTIDGLDAGKRYAYVVETAGQSVGGEFRTAPDAAEPFSFVVFGDTRSNADAHRALVDRVRGEVPDFILLTGDMVDDGSRDADWQTFFNVERDLMRENVIYPAVGNHDRQGGGTDDSFRLWFSLPTGAPDSERSYSFTWGNSRFIVLDSNVQSYALTDQTAWLEHQLAVAVADPQIAHRFIVMHHPVFSVSIHGGQPDLREAWTPLFERYGVDAVFSGHDHVYSRAFKAGVNYFVSGGGGAPLYPRDPRASRADTEATVYFERTNHYLRVQVTGGFVEVTAVRDDGTVIESLSWGTPPRRQARRPAGP